MREFTRFGDVSVKVCHDANERFAYIYYRNYEDAREARHAKSRLVLFDKQLEVEPIYEPSMPSGGGGRRRSTTPDYGPPPQPPLAGNRNNMRGPPPMSPPPNHRRPMNNGPQQGMSQNNRSNSSGGGYSRGGNYNNGPPMHHNDHHSSSSSHHYDQHGPSMHQNQRNPMHHNNGNGRSNDYHSNMNNHQGGGGNNSHHHSHHHQSQPQQQQHHHHHNQQQQMQHHNQPPHHMNNNNHGMSNHSNNGSGNNNQQQQRLQRESKKDKFPNYLHHIPPEDDDKATRTLFVGNLEVTISDQDLKRIFERYGVVEDIDVKRPPPGSGNAYAFIKFLNLDMAHRCKVEMSGQYIGKFQCKIGYGKCTPTTRIWVGGLGSWTSLTHLEREFDRFGAIRKIDFVKGDNHAYIQYDSIDAAQAACQEMRGFPLGGPDKRLRVDFADPEPYSYPFAGGSPGRGGPNSSEPTGYASDAVSKNGGDAVLSTTSSNAAPVAANTFSNRFAAKESVDRKDLPSDSEIKSNRDFGANNGTSGWWSGSGGDSGSHSPRAPTKRPRTPDMEIIGKRARSDSEERSGNASGPIDSMDIESNAIVSEPDKSPIDGRTGHVPDSVSTLTELMKCCAQAWNGVLMVKNSAFPARMLLCGGDPQLVELLMKDANGDLPSLRITQRLRLDPVKLDDVSRRMTTAGPTGHCILLTTPSASSSSSANCSGSGDESVQNRPLRNLVSYLKQKDAAGVISLTCAKEGRETAGVLYAFPPCSFALDLLKKLAPNLQTDPAKEDYLVIVVVKGTN